MWDKTEVYPIVVCMGIAIGWLGLMSGSAMMGPDVSIMPERRGSAYKDQATIAAEAGRLLDDRKKYIAKDLRDMTLFGSIEKRYA